MAASPKQFPSHFKSQQDQELIRRALKQSAFFTSLDDEQVDRFVKVAVRKEFAPDKIIILEGCVDDDDEDQTTSQSVEKNQNSPRDATEGLVEPDEYLLDHENDDRESNEKNEAEEEQIRAPKASR